MGRSRHHERHTVPGTAIQLYPIEARIVDILRHHPGKPVPHATILRQLWPDRQPSKRDQAHLRELIHRIRATFEDETGQSAPIQTILGRGYVWERT